MKIGFKFAALAAAVTLAVGSQAIAQFDVDGANAAMRLNGNDPSVTDPTDHDVLVGVPGLVIWEVITGANAVAPIIFIDSLVDPTTGSTLAALPWGGSLDIGTFTGGIPGGLVLRGDGLGMTVNPLFDPFFVSDNGNALLGLLPTFTQAMSAHTGFNGLQVASQCIVRDVTAAPFFLDNTQAVSAEFVIGQVLSILTGEDGSVNVPFVTGNVFNFHGSTKSDIWVNGNGFLNFNNLTSNGTGGFDNDNVLMANAEPAIFIGQTDWSIDGFGFGDGVLYEELGTQLRVSWGDPIAHSQGGCPHFADADLNTFEVVLQLQDGALSNPADGQFELRSLVLDPNANTAYGVGVCGHTPGAGVNPATVADINLRTGINTSNANEAQLEEHDFNNWSATTYGFDGVGTPRNYNNYTINWNGNTCLFIPNAGLIAGDNGYTNLPTAALPSDDVQGISQTSLSSAGGETITAFGSFFGFDPAGSGAGTVVLDAAGTFGGPYVCAINGIYDSTGQAGVLALPNPGPTANRDGQALEFVTPALGGSGNYSLTITCASGYVFNGNALVVAPGTVTTSYTLPDDGSITHALQPGPGVMFYGVVRTSLILNSNGYVTTTAGSGDFSETTAEFFGGWNFSGNAGVAVCYNDLNSGGTGSGATYNVIEDTVGLTVTVAFNNQNFWNTVAPAGSFAVTFAADGVTSQQTFDYSLAVNDAGNGDTPIVGVTDGVTGGNDTFVGSAASLLAFSSPLTGNDSVCAQDPSGTWATTLQAINGTGIFTALDITGLGDYFFF